MKEKTINTKAYGIVAVNKETDKRLVIATEIRRKSDIPAVMRDAVSKFGRIASKHKPTDYEFEVYESVNTTTLIETKTFSKWPKLHEENKSNA